MRWPLALVAFCACGDNALPAGEPLSAGADLVIVAHQDDDLYFMQPDLLEAVQRGRGITSVYVTAGDDQHGVNAPDVRYAGLRYAYGEAAGSNAWHCGFISIEGHAAQHCRLADKPVSLVFLAYPDGGIDGEFPQSLLKLWEGQIPSAETVAHETTSYTQDELVETVAQVVRETHPETIRTLDVASTHGHDHTDHMIVGAIALFAAARAHSTAELISYRGYSILGEAANKPPAILEATSKMVAYYEACSAKCAACGAVCDSIDPSHVAWFARRYAIGFRRFAHGRLQTDTGCVTAGLTIDSCDAAPVWSFDQGQLHLDDRCLATDATGAVELAPCSDDLSQRFSVDDEGHIWSVLVPPAQTGMAYAHASCLAPAATGIQTRLCGRDPGAPTWSFSPPIVSTPRATLGISASGRAVRLGDVDGDGYADLCTVDGAMLACASGDGAGGFTGPATARFALAIDPSTLTLGDLDNDGQIDACGSDGTHIVCALAANGFVAAPWSALVQPGTSLAAVDSSICDLDAGGVECASPAVSRTLSTWPTAGTPIWPADLDGDGQPDWCAASPGGLACAVAAESSISTDGGAWSFSLAGAIDQSALSDASVGVGDVDDDGRADLCALEGSVVKCARSQGHGFGPRVTLATFAADPAALWIGDLNGDGRADACVDAGATIDCTVP